MDEEAAKDNKDNQRSTVSYHQPNQLSDGRYGESKILAGVGGGHCKWDYVLLNFAKPREKVLRSMVFHPKMTSSDNIGPT